MLELITRLLQVSPVLSQRKAEQQQFYCLFCFAVKRAYHRVSLKVHPDRVVGGGEAEKRDATRRFQALGKAYSVLSDRDKRAVYDETGAVLGSVSF